MIFRYPDPASAGPDTPTLRVEVIDDGRAVTIDVRGEVDIATSELLFAGIEHALSKQPSHLSIQLSQVSFFGAAGVRALLMARRIANEQAVELVLGSPSSRVLTVLELVRVKELFKIENGSSARMPPSPE